MFRARKVLKELKELGLDVSKSVDLGGNWVLRDYDDPDRPHVIDGRYKRTWDGSPHLLIYLGKRFEMVEGLGNIAKNHGLSFRHTYNIKDDKIHFIKDGTIITAPEEGLGALYHMEKW